MKQKLLILLTLLLCVCSGAWADTTIFSLSDIKTNVSVDATSTYDLIPGTDATISGGYVSVYNSKDSEQKMLYNSGYINLAGSGSMYIHIIMSANHILQNGDIIAFTSTESDKPKVKIGTTTSASSKTTTETGSGTKIYTYTVTSGDGLAGASEIYILKDEMRYISGITITGSGEISNFTLTSSADVKVAPTATSQIEYTTSSTGAVTYTSSNESVATVSSTGLITGVTTGSATITVSQAANATYRAGGATITVNVQNTTTHTGEWVLDTENGSRDGNTYTTKDGSLVLTGTLDDGSNTYNDLKDSHFKHKDDITITLPSNYAVSTLWFVGYSNGDSDQTITLKSVDGTAVTSQSGTILKRNQIPATDCVGFELATAATKSIVVNLSNQCRGYFILNPAAQNITLTQVGENYYASYYSAGEMTITGATAYTAQLNGAGTALTLTECVGGVVPARTGVILIGNSSSATATPSFTGATKEQGDLIGAAQKEVSATADKTFVLGVVDGVAGLYKYTGSKLGVNKAYLYNETLAASARSLEFVFDNGTTAINGVSAEQVKAELKKFFENGKLVIQNNGRRYNAAGQQLK